MAKNDITTLLIIGNGFDLQCGLKTSYADFFAWLRKDSKRANDNFWTVHFLNNMPTGNGWVDVEAKLLKILPKNKGVNQFLRQCVSRANSYVSRRSGIGTVRHCEDKETEYIAMYIMNNIMPSMRPFSFNSCWFLDELNKFENQFSEYLRTEVSGKKDSYTKNVAQLMSTIADDGEVLNVLNFNYTDPFGLDCSHVEFNKKYMDLVRQKSNVHGVCEEDNIIFGVDYTEDLAQDMHIFTKTHRKMTQSINSEALPWHISTIKFYGHSLGKADYSYFQSIFDNYNLYGGDLSYGQPRKPQVVLQFYFCIYDESAKTDIIRDATDSVYKLITVYGATLDNKDKGRNLLHKLLLEGRVRIEFLNNI